MARSPAASRRLAQPVRRRVHRVRARARPPARAARAPRVLRVRVPRARAARAALVRARLLQDVPRRPPRVRTAHVQYCRLAAFTLLSAVNNARAGRATRAASSRTARGPSCSRRCGAAAADSGCLPSAVLAHSTRTSCLPVQFSSVQFRSVQFSSVRGRYCLSTCRRCCLSTLRANSRSNRWVHCTALHLSQSACADPSPLHFHYTSRSPVQDTSRAWRTHSDASPHCCGVRYTRRRRAFVSREKVQ